MRYPLPLVWFFTRQVSPLPFEGYRRQWIGRTTGRTGRKRKTSGTQRNGSRRSSNAPGTDLKDRSVVCNWLWAIGEKENVVVGEVGELKWIDVNHWLPREVFESGLVLVKCATSPLLPLTGFHSILSSPAKDSRKTCRSLVDPRKTACCTLTAYTAACPPLVCFFRDSAELGLRRILVIHYLRVLRVW